jgi:hypothetical protein
LSNKDAPFEPAEYESIDWFSFAQMKQDIDSYFVKVDEFGDSELDSFCKEKMNFGKDEELPIVPPPSNKTRKSIVPAKRVPTALALGVKTRGQPRPSIRPAPTVRTARNAIVTRQIKVLPAKQKQKFIREDMQDEIAALQREELSLCKEDDYALDLDS